MSDQRLRLLPKATEFPPSDETVALGNTPHFERMSSGDPLHAYQNRGQRMCDAPPIALILNEGGTIQKGAKARFLNENSEGKAHGCELRIIPGYRITQNAIR